MAAAAVSDAIVFTDVFTVSAVDKGARDRLPLLSGAGRADFLPDLADGKKFDRGRSLS